MVTKSSVKVINKTIELNEHEDGKQIREDMIVIAGKAAGICYMPDDIETLFSEPEEKTVRRSNMTLNSGHHSVFNHPVYNLSLEGIPKILAMIREKLGTGLCGRSRFFCNHV